MATPPESKSIAKPVTKRAATLKPVAPSAPAKPTKALEKSGALSEKAKKAAKPDSIKMKKSSFHMLETEQEALFSLKHVLSDALGKKVKKDELLRVAVRLLLKQTQAKVKAELAAITLSSEAAPA